MTRRRNDDGASVIGCGGCIVATMVLVVAAYAALKVAVAILGPLAGI